MALTVFVNPTPSLAYTQYGCAYPYACVYTPDKEARYIVGRFRDVTSNWQFAPHARFGHLAIVNTRNDDVVYYLYSHEDGVQRTGCLLPNGNISWYGTIFAVRIDSNSYCSGLNPA